MDTELIEANVHRLLGAMTGAATTAMVVVGDQLGLYRALAGGGPATAGELAARTGTAARYVREWLSQQAAAGFVAYRAGDGRYVLTGAVRCRHCDVTTVGTVRAAPVSPG